VDDLIVKFGGSGIYIAGYEDDMCLLAVGNVETRCNEVGLLANPDKTELVAFTRKRKLPGFFKPHFFGVTLSLSRSV
jgi:hypothetical protein